MIVVTLEVRLSRVTDLTDKSMREAAARRI
jgi:hypothetical protein